MPLAAPETFVQALKSVDGSCAMLCTGIQSWVALSQSFSNYMKIGSPLVQTYQRRNVCKGVLFPSKWSHEVCRPFENIKHNTHTHSKCSDLQTNIIAIQIMNKLCPGGQMNKRCTTPFTPDFHEARWILVPSHEFQWTFLTTVGCWMDHWMGQACCGHRQPAQQSGTCVLRWTESACKPLAVATLAHHPLSSSGM